MKKIGFALLISVLFTATFALMSQQAYASDHINVTINGQAQNFAVPAQLINGHTMLPLRDIAESLGLSVAHDPITNNVTLTQGSLIISHRIGTAEMTINGTRTVFDASSVTTQGRTLVPVRMIAEAVGAEVEWIAASRTVAISTALSVSVNVSQTAVAAPVAAETGWRTLSEIQNQRGVFIKRGDRFLPLTLEAENPGFGGNLALHNLQRDAHVFQAGDQFVYVGNINSIQIHALTSTGYFIAHYSSDLRYFGRSRAMRANSSAYLQPSRGNWGHMQSMYTHINGLEIATNPHLERYMRRLNPNNGIQTGIYLLQGFSGEQITLGRWNGTTWTERQLTANREAFHMQRLQHTVDRTFNGYFVIDVPLHNVHYLQVGWTVPDSFSGRDFRRMVEVQQVSQSSSSISDLSSELTGLPQNEYIVRFSGITENNEMIVQHFYEWRNIYHEGQAIMVYLASNSIPSQNFPLSSDVSISVINWAGLWPIELYRTIKIDSLLETYIHDHLAFRIVVENGEIVSIQQQYQP